ncbi:MAG: outer membrane lipoprotein carrier protein LolA [Acidobacteriota bacterium]
MTAARHPTSTVLTALLTLLLTLAAPLTADEPPPDPDEAGLSASERIERLIEQIRYQQAKIETLQASFVQVRESELLLEPETSTGELSYRVPGSVLWDFAEPSNTLVRIDGGEMLTWFRDLGRAERVDVGRQTDQVLEYLSAGGSLDTLRRYFLITAKFPKDAETPYRLDLKPKFRRVAQRISGMAMELDRRAYFPVYLRYEEPTGDVTELRFSDVVVNEPIPDERFAIDLPADVEVRELEFGEHRDRDQ